jgi:hypothetical protein
MDWDQLLALSHASFEQWLAASICTKANIRRYALQLEILERDFRMVSEELEKSRVAATSAESSVIFNEWLGQQRAARDRADRCSAELRYFQQHEKVVDQLVEEAWLGTVGIAAWRRKRVDSPSLFMLREAIANLAPGNLIVRSL